MRCTDSTRSSGASRLATSSRLCASSSPRRRSPARRSRLTRASDSYPCRAMSNSSDSLAAQPRLDGLVPERLKPRTRKIVLQDYDLNLDIGFHTFEIGNPQRLLVTV